MEHRKAQHQNLRFGLVRDVSPGRFARRHLLVKSCTVPSASTVNRRAFRFSLSALFAAVTVCAVFFAWLRVPLEQMRQEADVAKRIERLGGRITWGGSLEGMGKQGRSYIGAIDLSGTEVTDDVASIGELNEMTHEALARRLGKCLRVRAQPIEWQGLAIYLLGGVPWQFGCGQPSWRWQRRSALRL